jgi:hypothetical protein
LPIAEQLINCDCLIWLMGIEGLDPAVAEVLLKHKPRDGTGFVFPTSLRENMVPAVALAFERHDGIHFGNAFSP